MHLLPNRKYLNRKFIYSFTCNHLLSCIKLYKNHQHNVSFAIQKGFLCSRHTAMCSKSIFYAVAIQRCGHKWFFIQSPYSGYAIMHFLCSRYTAEATFIHFSCFRQLAKPTSTHFCYYRQLAKAHIHAFFILLPISESIVQI